MKPYYHDERAGITIYHGDCREVMPLLGIPDAVVTDPPYGISHSSSHGASWQNTQIQNDGDTSVRDLVREWCGDFRPWAMFGTWKTPPPRDTRGCLVWDKGPAFGMGDLAFPWKPSWELIYIGGDDWTGRRDEGVLRGPVVVSWESKGRAHPHEKPEWITTHLIQKISADRCIVDPFMGTGPTLASAKALGRTSVGIEIEEKYCEIAVKRLAQEYLFTEKR